jgi:predicted membrane channel-forming protein YqfA (hemolysin III family)
MVAYSRVPQNDNDSARRAEDDEREHEERKKKRTEKMDRINNKIHAVMWVAAMCFTVYHTDFFRVLFESPLVNRYSGSVFVVGAIAVDIVSCQQFLFQHRGSVLQHQHLHHHVPRFLAPICAENRLGVGGILPPDDTNCICYWRHLHHMVRTLRHITSSYLPVCVLSAFVCAACWLDYGQCGDF